ncbi:MAG TPA: YhdP family protein [Rudaea sp.]|nr:YhdP family protein [Rudaea sp.]
MTGSRRRLHRARLVVQALFATAVILFAAAAGLVQLSLPWLAAHPEKIAAFLSERLNRPVSVERVEAVWERNGPLLLLNGVRIGGGTPEAQSMTVPQAGLKINLFSWLHRNQRWNEFRVIGLDLKATRDLAGKWTLHGFDQSGADTGEGNPLFDMGALVVRDLRLTVDDAMSGRHLVLGGDEVRLVNSGNHHRVLARLRCLETNSPPLDAVVDYDSDENAGELYVGGPSLDLAAVMHGYPLAGVVVDRGGGRAQVWAWWRNGAPVEARLELDLNGIVLSTQAPIVLDEKRQIAPRVAFDRLSLGARWRRSDTGWGLDIADLVLSRQGEMAPAATVHVERTDGAEGADASYAADAQSLDIAVPASVAMLSDALPGGLRSWLYEADPVGELHRANLRYAGAHDFDAAAQLRGISWHPAGQAPGISNLDGTLLADDEAVSLSLPAHTPFGIDAPHVFRRPLEFSEFGGDIVGYRSEAQPVPRRDGDAAQTDASARDGWRVETDALTFEGAGYGGELRGAVELHGDGSKPLLDVYAALTHAEVPASHLFWPINAISPKGVSFLDRALDAGRVTAARVSFRGDLADWPFRNFAGRFEARAETEDVRFVYLPDWPAAEHVRAVADFVNNSLHADIASAQSQGVKISAATADIGDLGEVVLDLGVSGSGAGRDLLTFLRATPIGQKYGEHLLGVDVGGQAKLDFRLNLPVKFVDRLTLNGNIVLSDADLADAKYNLHLNKANGRLRFTQRGFATDELPVTMNGKPAKFSLAVGALTADPHHAVEARLQAMLPARDVMAYAPQIQAYSDHVSGSALWDAALLVDNDTAGTREAQRLTLASDLRGVTLDLPAPLAKPSDQPLPLAVTLGLPLAGGSLDVRLADWLHLHGRLASLTQPFAARVDLGGGAGQNALPGAGFLIAGKVEALDLTGWLDVTTSRSAETSGAAGGGMLAGVDVAAQSLRAYDRDFGAGTFKLVPTGEGLDLGFVGPNLDGSLRVPAENLRQRGITAQLTRLYWPESGDAGDGEPSAMSTANPANVPPLHLHVADFRLGDANFGDTTLESYPVADGMHVEQVSTHSNNLEMRARGDWTGRPGSDVSRFSIDFTARDLGRMLDAFGYAGVVDGGQTLAHIEGRWSGPPSGFALAKLDGTLKADIQQGRIPEANTGAGRIFGLFNLSALPRRLTLDFGDLFKSGLSFDSIKGVFTLKDGNAVTNDLEVKGPTADIRVSGRTGLKAKDYDQIMDVTPHVGGTLAVGGAIVGGPIGAAAGALLQGIFRNQINQAARIRYSVTGSWDKPTITQLSRESLKPSSRAREKAAPPGTLRGASL